MNKILSLLLGFCIALSLYGDDAPGKAEPVSIRNVTIEGCVKQPGQYSLDVQGQLMLLIGKAGGITRLSNRKVYIVRGRHDNISVNVVDFDRLLIDKKDYTLFDGDRIFLPVND